MNKNDEKVRVSKGTLKTAKRLLRYVTSRYKVPVFCRIYLYHYQFRGFDLCIFVSEIFTG